MPVDVLLPFLTGELAAHICVLASLHFLHEVGLIHGSGEFIHTTGKVCQTLVVRFPKTLTKGTLHQLYDRFLPNRLV
jgi:hypothetical protein